MIALGRVVLPGLLSMLAVAMHAQPVETGGSEPILPRVRTVAPDDEAHCGCGEGKMARVAAATRAFASEVDALDRDIGDLAIKMIRADAIESRLAAAEQACRQRQSVPDAPMSNEMRQWSDACARVSLIAAHYGAIVQSHLDVR